jgi:cytochrome c-type biogenesis protein CcmH/NrfF
VAVVVMVTMAAVATLVTLVSQAAQDTAQHLSNERHCKSCESEHRAFSF